MLSKFLTGKFTGNRTLGGDLDGKKTALIKKTQDFTILIDEGTF